MTTVKFSSFWFSGEKYFDNERKLLNFAKWLAKEHKRQGDICNKQRRQEEMMTAMEVPDLMLRVTYSIKQLTLNF